MDKVQKTTEAVGGVEGGYDVTFLICLFFNFLSVCPLSCPLWFIFFHPRCGLRTQQSSGTAKECSLHSYRVNEWMDGWMNGVISDWTNGRVWLKMRKPASWGRSRSWTFCLITVLFSCCVFGFSDIQRRVFIEENPADMKTVRYCFVTFYLNSRFSSIPFSREATSELSVQHKVLFLCVFFFFFPNRGKGATNTTMCKRTLTLLSNTCITLQASLNSFPPFSSHFGKILWAVDWDGKGEKKNTKHKAAEWTGAVMRHRCVTLM